MKGDEIVGSLTKVKVVKNKMAPPFKEAEFEIRYPTGIDRVSSAVDAAVGCGVLEKAGSWYKYNGENIAQGKDATMMVLKEDKKLLAEIARKIKESLA
jgi:recombination protein RecA